MCKKCKIKYIKKYLVDMWDKALIYYECPKCKKIKQNKNGK